MSNVRPHNNRSMSLTAAHATKFYEQVVADGRVFTFIEDEAFLVYPMHGREVVPFWSSRSRLERIQKNHPKYSKYTISEMTLEEFLDKTLVQLEEECISVGVNWSGSRLVGYDITTSELRNNIGYWQSRGAREA
jgi:hypothetical protein